MTRCVGGKCGLAFFFTRPPRAGTITLHVPGHREYEVEGNREGGV